MTTWNKIGLIIGGANFGCILINLIGGHYFAALFNLFCFLILVGPNWVGDEE